MTEPTPPTVPGLVVGRLLGAHARLGRDLATGEFVVLRPLPAGADPQRLLGVVEHPRLLLPRVVADAEGRTHLVVPWLPGGGLDAVLSEGALGPGQVGTVVRDLADVLAVLHDRGRVHGGIRAEAVLLDSSGGVVLDGTALAVAGNAGPADDVAALAALALACLGEGTGRGVAALRHLLEGVAAGAAPTARELSGAVAAEAAPQPVRRDRARPQPAVRGRSRAGPALRWVVGGFVVAAVLGLAVAVGSWWADHRAGPTPQELVEAAGTSSSPPPAVDWAAVVADLDARRAAAFTAGDPALLAAVTEPGSPAARADEAALEALAARGLAVVGLATDVVSATPIRVGADLATVRVADVRRAYRLTADGAVVGDVPERGGAWLVELRRGADGVWRVSRVVPTADE